MQRRPAVIEPADLARLQRALDAHARLEGFAGLRLRAIVMLAHASALDLREALAIDADSMFTERPRARRWTIEAPRYLRLLARHPYRTPPFILPKPEHAPALDAVRAYVDAAVELGSLTWRPARVPLFHDVTERGKPRPLSPRTIQAQFAAVQRAAQLAARYRFADLRHDAISRFADDYAQSPSLIAAYARISTRSALAYLPPDVIARVAHSLARMSEQTRPR